MYLNGVVGYHFKRGKRGGGGVFVHGKSVGVLELRSVGVGENLGL